MGGIRNGRHKKWAAQKRKSLCAACLDIFLDTGTIHLHHKTLTKTHVYKLKNPELLHVIRFLQKHDESWLYRRIW